VKESATGVALLEEGTTEPQRTAWLVADSREGRWIITADIDEGTPHLC